MGRQRVTASCVSRRLDGSKAPRYLDRTCCRGDVERTGQARGLRGSQRRDSAWHGRRPGRVRSGSSFHSGSGEPEPSPSNHTLRRTRAVRQSGSNIRTRGATMAALTDWVDLASERLGGRVTEANDEFFAEKENLLKASEPVFVSGKY